MQRENGFIFYIFDAIRQKGEKKQWKEKLTHSVHYKEHVATCNSRA